MSRVASFHLGAFKVHRSVSKLVTLPAERWELTSTEGCVLGKVLGTSARNTTKFSVDISRWAIFAVWEDEVTRKAFLEDSSILERWRSTADSIEHFMLSPVLSRGTWGGMDPFNGIRAVQRYEGEVAILTRASIPLLKFWRFARSVPVVDSSLQAQPGCSLALGIGEWPVGQQSTFSIWNSLDDALTFAYKTKEHTNVIKRTRDEGWFSEEMFTRFRVTERL